MSNQIIIFDLKYKNNLFYIFSPFLISFLFYIYYYKYIYIKFILFYVFYYIISFLLYNILILSLSISNLLVNKSFKHDNQHPSPDYIYFTTYIFVLIVYIPIIWWIMVSLQKFLTNICDPRALDTIILPFIITYK